MKYIFGLCLTTTMLLASQGTQNDPTLILKSKKSQKVTIPTHFQPQEQPKRLKQF